MKIDLCKILVDFLIRNKKIEKLENIPISEINNILFVSNTAIGDTLFNTPVFRSLRINYPDKRIIVLMNPINYKLFETNKYIDEIILYDGKWINFYKVLNILKRKNIDLTFILHSNEPQATPLSVLIGSKYIIKIPNKKNEYNKFHTNLPIGAIENKHGIFDRLKQLEYIGIVEKNPKMDLFLKEQWINKVNIYLEKNGVKKDSLLIGFQIGASTISRMWFNDRWIKLGKELLKKYPYIKIVLTGSPHENHLTSLVENGINDLRVINAAGKLDLGSAASLIGKLNLFITPDTGPLHIATALKIPTIAFFVVANHIGSNSCYDKDIHLYIQKEKTCTPCIGKNCKFQECMLQISIDDVIKKFDYLHAKLRN